MLSLLTKQFASKACGSRQLISSVQKTRIASSVFGSTNNALKSNYHTSSIFQIGRDRNILTNEDTYDWTQLQNDVFKDFDYGVKKAPQVKKVTYWVIVE
jgi:hypothetical protein